MTGNTGCSDGGVIEARRDPGRWRVAIITGIAGLQMSQVFASGIDTIMAGVTGGGYAGVINTSRNPGR